MIIVMIYLGGSNVILALKKKRLLWWLIFPLTSEINYRSPQINNHIKRLAFERLILFTFQNIFSIVFSATSICINTSMASPVEVLLHIHHVR